MLDIINHNPYRLVGVFATSTRREIVANIARIKANLRVNRQISFPSDLDPILHSSERTVDSIAEAESKLTLPKDVIRYAQFWFINETELDKIAINNLSIGSIDKAISIWDKQENLSSVHNRLLSYLIIGNYGQAMKMAFLFYAKYSQDFINLILGAENKVVAANNLEFDFLDTLCDEIGASEVSLYIISKEWGEYVGNKIIDPIINSIDHCISITKGTKGKGANTRLDAGTKLMADTISPLQKLKGELSTSNPKYQIIADKLGLEILQCGIDYYNGTDDDDAAYKAMKLQECAQSIVVGKMAKDRCDENVRILKGIISKLPPSEVVAEHKTIHSNLVAFAIQPDLIRFSIELIKSCAPHLVSIKEKLGNTNGYYLKLSTTVVNNALGNIIAEVNDAQNKDFNALKATLILAWRTQLYLDKFDLEKEYKEGRFKESRNALYGIINNCKGFEDSNLSFMYQYGCGWCNDLDVSDLDMRTDDEIFRSCSNLPSYKEYIKRFPSGKHFLEAKSKIIEIRFRNCKTVADFQMFISEFPDSSFVPKAQKELNKLVCEENERKARIVRQEKALSVCSTTNDVVALYESEKANKIDIDKCSLKAYELAQNEEEHQKVVSVFGIRSIGGKKATTKLQEIERIRKEKVESRSKILKRMLWVIIPLVILLVIYLIWGVRGFAV